MTNKEIVATKWSAYEQDLNGTFFGCPVLRPYLISSAFGPEYVEAHKGSPFFFEEIVSEHFLKHRMPRRALSLCCGHGQIELKFAQLLPSLELLRGVDLAPGAVAVANQRAEEEGLDDRVVFEVADLNNYDWKGESYDLVIANGALHHLSNLDVVISGLHSALAPGGLLYAKEHVGASYQDYPDRQLELINAFSYLVPPRLRNRTPSRFRSKHFYLYMLDQVWNGAIELPQGNRRRGWAGWLRAAASAYDRWRAMRQKAMPKFHFGLLHDSKKSLYLHTDPSEGVSAADIIPTLKQTFGHVEVRPFGGGAIPYALDHEFYRKASLDNPSDLALIDTLGKLERGLMEIGELRSEYAILFCEKS